MTQDGATVENACRQLVTKRVQIMRPGKILMARANSCREDVQDAKAYHHRSFGS